MSPCEELGYKVGDKFEVISSSGTFSVGSVIELDRDDGTSEPHFKLVSGRCHFCKAAYCSLEKIRKIENQMNISIPCPEGYEFDGIRQIKEGDYYLCEHDYKTVIPYKSTVVSVYMYIALKKNQLGSIKFEFERVEGNEIDNGLYWTDYANKVPVEWREGKKTLNQLDLFRSAAIWRLKDDNQG